MILGQGGMWGGGGGGARGDRGGGCTQAFPRNYYWVSEAPHWGVQSRFRVIYIYIYMYIYVYICIYIYICMSVGLSTIVYGKPYKKMVCQNAWAELHGPNTRMLIVTFVILKQSAAWKP